MKQNKLFVTISWFSCAFITSTQVQTAQLNYTCHTAPYLVSLWHRVTDCVPITLLAGTCRFSEVKSVEMFTEMNAVNG